MLRSHEQPMQYLPPASSTEGRRQANRGRMSKRAVSIEVQVSGFSTKPETLKGPRKPLFLGKLELDDSALQTDHGGVGTVVGAQF